MKNGEENVYIPGNVPEKGKSSGEIILSVIAVFLMVAVSMPTQISGNGTTFEDVSVPSRYVIDVPKVDSLEYIAIGPSEFQETMEPLINWKTQKGVKAIYIPLDGEDGIEAVSYGRDIQEIIRNYIQALHDVNVGLKWVLLAGDGEIIPPRRTFVNGSSDNGADDNDNYVMSDFYYAGLTNSWDLDGDNIFGEDDEDISELDFEAEVNVGRFPASNVDELKLMVDRQLSYERDPPPGSWSSSSLLAGSLMDAPNNPSDFDPYKDNAYELVLKVEDQLPEDVTAFQLLDYPRLDWGGYNRMFDTLNSSSFKDYYEMGFSTALLACHGDLNGNCTDYKGDSGGNKPYWQDYDVYFNYTTAETIENGPRVPLLYISNCDSLNFTEEDDTNMERIMRNPDGGAIGIIGASVTTYRGEYRDETSWGNWWLAQKFFDILYHKTQKPGEALYDLKWEHIKHVSQRDLVPAEERMFHIDNLAYNLLGDPEGAIWIREPRELEVDFPAIYYQDNTSFEVTVRDPESDNPLPGCVVTLMDPDDEEVYFVSTTGPDGSSEIYFRPETLNDLMVTITKEGYLPFTSPVEVGSLINLVMLDDLVLEPEIPVFGNPFTIIAKVKNDGLAPLDDVIVTIELSAGEESQRPDKRILHMDPGEEVIVNDLSFTPYHGINHIVASVEIVSDSLESRIDDNQVEMDIQVNEPIIFKTSLPNVAALEDNRLSTLESRINISNYIFDPDDYPEKPSFSVSSLEPNLTGEIDENGLLDVIPFHDWSGTGYLEVHVSDGSVTASRDLKVVVEPVPDPPSFEEWPGSINGSENQPLYFLLYLEDVDSPDVNLSSATSRNIEFRKVANSSAIVYNVTLIPDEKDVGTSVLTIIATDKDGETADVRISMEIFTTNDPPEIIYPESVSIKPGEGRVRIPLDIFDPDNDQDIQVGAIGDIVRSFIFADGVLTVDFLTDLDSGSKYTLEVFVDDMGTGGNVTFNVGLDVEKEDRASIYYTSAIIIVLLVILLASYGIIIRLQESRQRKLLDKVGDEAMMARTGKGRRRRSKADPIQMPPAPEDAEGGEVAGDVDAGKIDPTTYQDLESELDEVIDELYSSPKGGNP